MNPYCVAIDWGTSSFRIWLMSGDGSALAERRSDEGMTHAATTGFSKVMEAHLQALQAPASLPVVICGMAGSRQGWTEARYLTVPAKLCDIVEKAVRVEGAQRDVRILPGLAQRDPERFDVMRGEETQLLGEFAGDQSSGLACMPGTHSKWVRIAAGRVTEFSTYMTGELFGLIARQSILRHAVGNIDTCDPGSAAFLGAVKEARDNPAGVSRLLFSIRAGQLLNGQDAASSYERLSGLLIGWEIAAARAEFGTGDKIHLVASGKLFRLYDAAFRSLGLKVPAIDADDAVLKGLMAGAQQFWPIPDHHTDYGHINA
ncbi:MAG: 2-dehydro-3-deoxygalactonokinase [Hyphomicrobiales bacterium]|nr:2-dehydro-3-deoxygalactonokinase [Hyphomicrobiales bacterium]MCP5000859.1 2-dehydro-3-deoxygalactonokinase [Hyphomicrobiales bacterium]